MNKKEVKELLETKYRKFNTEDFIPSDPISIPRSFHKLQDIEISAFFAASFAWGQRVTIINKCKELLNLMDNSPYDFMINHSDNDLKVFKNFKHRTFQPTDTLYFIDFFKRYYSEHTTLEDAFLHGRTMEERLINFHKEFFNVDYAPDRTRKHVATPARKSTCKRINMFLRWMVRRDESGVDFGLWDRLKSEELICPLDVHVERVARKLKLIKRKQTDWLTALELTDQLRKFDSRDPVKYDFALFGLAVNGELH